MISLMLSLMISLLLAAPILGGLGAQSTDVRGRLADFESYNLKPPTTVNNVSLTTVQTTTLLNATSESGLLYGVGINLDSATDATLRARVDITIDGATAQQIQVWTATSSPNWTAAWKSWFGDSGTQGGHRTMYLMAGGYRSSLKVDFVVTAGSGSGDTADFVIWRGVAPAMSPALPVIQARGFPDDYAVIEPANQSCANVDLNTLAKTTIINTTGAGAVTGIGMVVNDSTGSSTAAELEITVDGGATETIPIWQSAIGWILPWVLTRDFAGTTANHVASLNGLLIPHKISLLVEVEVTGASGAGDDVDVCVLRGIAL